MTNPELYMVVVEIPASTSFPAETMYIVYKGTGGIEEEVEYQEKQLRRTVSIVKIVGMKTIKKEDLKK